MASRSGSSGSLFGAGTGGSRKLGAAPEADATPSPLVVGRALTSPYMAGQHNWCRQ